MGDYFRRISFSPLLSKVAKCHGKQKRNKRSAYFNLNKTKKKMESHLIDIRGITYTSASCFGKS